MNGTGATKQAEDDKVTAYGWYVGLMLMLVSMISMLDRKALVMLAEPIKRDLHLSDTQLGFLTGGVFTLVYAVGSIPLARLADRASRSKLIGVCMIVWSLLTALGGSAVGFTTLALSRVGVALGEAGANPTAHALLTSHFPPAARGKGFSLLLAGTPLGVLLGLFLGGWLNDMFDWRTALYVLGVPGVAVALLVIFTVRDGARSSPSIEIAGSGKFLATVAKFARTPTLRNLFIATSLLFVMVGGMNSLFGAYLMRRFEIPASMVGLGYGLTLGTSAMVGSIISGIVTDRVAKTGGSARIIAMLAAALALAGGLTVVLLNSSSYTTALLLIGITNFLLSLYAGPTFTTLQAHLTDNMRAMGAAVFLLGINGIGSSLGPLLVGGISDMIAIDHQTSAESLRVGLLATVPFCIVASLFFARTAYHEKRN